jgi:uncharacterized integral membrane protein
VKKEKGLVDETTDTLSTVMHTAEQTIERRVAPVRKRVLQRFPILFLLLVTLGATATIIGLEQILLQITFLQNNPVALLIIGLALLVLTGTLYKKLG